jgi:hypothetical protein
MALLFLGLQWTREQVGVPYISFLTDRKLLHWLSPSLAGVLTIFNPIGSAAS